jgi:hypothetical protein
MRTAFDCDQRNLKTDAAQWFYDSGANSSTPYTAPVWEAVLPDSTGERMLRYVCALDATAALGSPPSTQQLIVPDKVTTEPLIDVGSDKYTSCGWRVHNLITRGNSVSDYDVQVIFLSSNAESRATTLVVARLRTMDTTSNNSQSSGVNFAPTDLYIVIPDFPETIRLKSVEPGQGGAPIGSYTGYPIAADGGVPSAEIPQRLTVALINQEPILVHFVMDSSSSGSHILRMVQNLTVPQQQAMLDCFKVLNSRANTSKRSSSTVPPQ